MQVLPTEEVVKQYLLINDKYNNTKTYEFNIKYISYKDYKTSIPYETSIGFFKKDGNNFYCKILDLYTMQNDNYKIIIDSSDKTISIASPSQVFESVFSVFDIETLFSNYAIVKTANFSGGLLFRIEPKLAYDIDSYEYLVDKSGWIKELTIFYNISLIDRNGDVTNIKPRLQMIFSINDKKVNKDEYNESRFFIKQGDNLVLTKEYKNFQLMDNRFLND